MDPRLEIYEAVRRSSIQEYRTALRGMDKTLASPGAHPLMVPALMAAREQLRVNFVILISLN